MMPITHCRLCLSKVTVQLSLSPAPIDNGHPDNSGPYSIKYPLDLAECPSCGHVQLGFSIPGDTLFADYKYRTPESERSRLRDYAELLKHLYPFALSADRPKVLEIGSNNGMFVDCLRAVGFFAVGIDPCGPQNGMPRWFSSKSAKNLVFSMGKMKLIVANNVFAHVDDLRNVFVGIAKLLDDDGVVVFEVPYFPNMVERGGFDMVRHEHKDYHTLSPLPRFLAKFGLCIRQYEHNNAHGGSIRVHCSRGDKGVAVPEDRVHWDTIAKKYAEYQKDSFSIHALTT